MAIAPLTSIPGNVSFTATGTDNRDRLAELSRTSSSIPSTPRSTGGKARRETAQRAASAETQQPATASRTYSRSQSADASALRAGRRDTAAERFTPRDPVSLSFEVSSTAGTKTNRADATNAGSGTSRTQVVQTTTATPTKMSTATSADAKGAGTASSAASAEQVLKAYDALLQQALGSEMKVPADLSHIDRVKLSADAKKALPPAKQAAFLQQAEVIGRSLGLNWGLTKIDAAGKRVPLNDGVAAKLDDSAAKEYAKIASQSPKAPSATPAVAAETTATDTTQDATQTPQAIAESFAAKIDGDGNGSISTEEIAAQKGTPQLAAAWAKISPDAKPVSKADFVTGLTAYIRSQTTPTAATDTPTPTASSTTTTVAAPPDAAQFMALDLPSALEAVGRMSSETIAVMVKSWAAGSDTLTMAQFREANPAMAAAYVGDGKETIGVATLIKGLTKLTGEQTTSPTTTEPTTTTVTPTADTQK